MNEKKENDTLKVLIELSVDKESILAKLEQIKKHADELSREAWLMISELKLSEKKAPEKSDTEIKGITIEIPEN